MKGALFPASRNKYTNVLKIFSQGEKYAEKNMSNNDAPKHAIPFRIPIGTENKGIKIHGILATVNMQVILYIKIH